MSDDPTATGLHVHAALARGSLVAGRFRVDRLLGVGGMGVVHLAEDTALGVPVAIKVLRPELAARGEAFERFRQELLLARQVSSPHVVRIHDIARDGGRWLISMDFVDGEALDARLAREVRLPVEDALRIARQVAAGLGAAHARGIVHRDLKPANVLLDREGNAYVNDFGVARSLAGSGRTRSGAVVGTPDYLSPEQARGDAVDGRSDLYALGLILHEMLTGDLPFADGTVAESLGRRMLRAPPPVSDARPELAPWVARLVDRLLRPQPGQRFADAQAVVDAIDRRAVPRGPRPWRAIAAAVAGAAVIAGAGAWWWLRAPGDAGAAATAPPPLKRLLVAPVAMDGGDAADAALALALGDLLRDAVAGAGVAVVDGARGWQAQRQLDATGAARVDPGTLRAVAAAERVLALRLSRDGGGWRARGQLLAEARTGGDRAGAVDCPRAPTALAAWRACLPALATLLALPADALAALPPEPALRAYGEAVRARLDGDPATAQRRFGDAVAAAPRFLQASLAQADAAAAVGDAAAASAALEAAAGDADGAPERLRRQATAARALAAGDAAAAVAAWQAALQAQPDDTHAALQLALAQAAAGEPDAAIAGLRAVVARDPDDPRAWYELGKLAILQGDARRAVDDYLLRALLLQRRGRDPYGTADTVNALGVGYGRLGQTAEAERMYREAVELRGRIGNRAGVATSLANLGGVLALRGDFDGAADALGRARGLHAELGDRAGIATIDSRLGVLAEERGDHRAALDGFRRALLAWREAGDPHGEADTLNDIGFAHYQLGAYDSAQAFWLQAAAAFDRLGDRTGAVRTTQNLALLDIARGDGAAARDRLDRALAEAERQQMVEEAAVTRRNLAELALLQGRIGDGLEQAAHAGEAFRGRNDSRGTADTLLLRAQGLLLAGAVDDARATLDGAADAFAAASIEQRAIARLLQGEAAARAGDAAAARAAWAEAATLAGNAGVRALQLRIALRAAPGTPSLDADIAALGRFGLRLAWLEQAMAAAAARRDSAAGVAAYREARTLLRGRDFVGAPRLHALGAEALAGSGDAAGAAAARDASSAAAAAVRAALPDALRAGYDPMQGAPPP